jgi:hypothetical protein
MKDAGPRPYIPHPSQKPAPTHVFGQAPFPFCGNHKGVWSGLKPLENPGKAKSWDWRFPATPTRIFGQKQCSVG